MHLFLLIVTLYVRATFGYVEEECKDFYFMCKTWKRYCNDPYNKVYMKENCKETCGLCPKCEDLSVTCSTVNCNDPGSEDFIRKKCRLTCGICAAPTTTPPPPPPPTWRVIPSGRCGIPKVQSGRIIGGVNAKKGAWPWQVLIKLAGGPYCGGSIISPFWVVTAAHCMYNKEPVIDDFEVVTGEHDYNKDEGTETVIGLSKIIVNKQYSPRTLDYDIALIKLKRPVPFGKYVGMVCLPGYNDDVPVGTECTISGWGKIDAFGEMHNKLQQAKLPIVPSSKCHDLNTNVTGISITDRMLCAGYGPTRVTSGCHGDSGGPLVCRLPGRDRWFLEGVVSWGSSRCNTKEAYTVFARISNLRKWIDDNI